MDPLQPFLPNSWFTCRTHVLSHRKSGIGRKAAGNIPMDPKQIQSQIKGGASSAKTWWQGNKIKMFGLQEMWFHYSRWDSKGERKSRKTPRSPSGDQASSEEQNCSKFYLKMGIWETQEGVGWSLWERQRWFGISTQEMGILGGANTFLLVFREFLGRTAWEVKEAPQAQR